MNCVICHICNNDVIYSDSEIMTLELPDHKQLKVVECPYCMNCIEVDNNEVYE